MKIPLKKKPFSFNLTLFRVILAIIILLVLFEGRSEIALYLFAFTAFLSFFERFIFKKKKSELRSIVDLIADKLLINLTAVALVILNALPLWVLLVFLGRDLLTIGAGAMQFVKDARREFRPTVIGRLMMFFQIVALIPPLLGSIDMILIWIAVIVTAISTIELLFKSEFRFRRKSDVKALFEIQKLLKIADIFTLANGMLGLAAIIFAIEGNHIYSMIALLLAVVSDFFDGKVARLLNQQNSFGKELDSLADTISFGVAPAVIGFTLIETPLAIFAFTVFLFCGILRLARFNVVQSKKPGFEGMPITLNGFLIPIIYFAGIPVVIYPYIYLVLGVLMVSSISFKKL